MLLIQRLVQTSLVLYLFAFSISLTKAEVSIDSEPEIKRIRIDFKNPDGFVRHLLLGFVEDNSATDNIDMGYDGRNPEYLPNDLNWIIEGQRFVIQGVGQFNNLKKYSLGLFMEEPGEIEISLSSLENFDSDTPVYLFDKSNGNYTLLNENSYRITVDSGTDLDRFLLTFSKEDENLGSEKPILANTLAFYKNTSNKSLIIESKDNEMIHEVSIFGIQGQKYFDNVQLETTRIEIPTTSISNNVIAVHVKVGNKISRKLLVLN